jgi:hypothetical protein
MIRAALKSVFTTAIPAEAGFGYIKPTADAAVAVTTRNHNTSQPSHVGTIPPRTGNRYHVPLFPLLHARRLTLPNRSLFPSVIHRSDKQFDDSNTTFTCFNERSRKHTARHQIAHADTRKNLHGFRAMFPFAPDLSGALGIFQDRIKRFRHSGGVICGESWSWRTKKQMLRKT